MRRVSHALFTLILLLLLMFSFERPAHAYIDPGSGLFLFQGVSSVAVGIAYFFRKRFRWLNRKSKTQPVEQ